MLKNKINSLQEQINKAQNKLKPASKKPQTNGSLVFNVAVEIVAGTIVGVIIGLFFDKLFDSRPTFLIICLVISIIAAFRSIWTKYINN